MFFESYLVLMMICSVVNSQAPGYEPDADDYHDMLWIQAHEQMAKDALEFARRNARVAAEGCAEGWVSSGPRGCIKQAGIQVIKNELRNGPLFKSDKESDRARAEGKKVAERRELELREREKEEEELRKKPTFSMDDTISKMHLYSPTLTLRNYRQIR